MTHKIINNINIKISEKKSKKRKYKKRNVRTHNNAPYSNVSTLLNNTNKPQQLDISTATTREKDGIINQAIMDVKKGNDILLLKDKVTNQKLLLDKPLFIDQTPKSAARMIQTDIRSPAFFNNRHKENDNFAIHEVYSNNDAFENDNVMELGEKKGKGRPMKTDNSISNEQLKKNLEYNKKQNEKYHQNKKIDPIHMITRNKEIQEKTKKLRNDEEKNNNKISEIFKSPEHLLSQNKISSILKSSDSINKRNDRLEHTKGRIDSVITKNLFK
jgi:hypothetical protein